MKYKKPRDRTSPEQKIVDGLKNVLKKNGWLVEKTHGNKFQAGWPDLYCFHPEHGARWIEVKTPTGYLTPAQGTKFKLWESFGVKIWILTSAQQYNFLFKECNWRDFDHKIRKAAHKNDFVNLKPSMKDLFKYD